MLECGEKLSCVKMIENDMLIFCTNPWCFPFPNAVERPYMTNWLSALTRCLVIAGILKCGSRKDPLNHFGFGCFNPVF